VLLLGDEAIHAVANPRRSFTGSIHVYGGDLMATSRSSEEAVKMAQGILANISQAPGFVSAAFTRSGAESWTATSRPRSTVASTSPPMSKRSWRTRRLE
jgi:hypothetical protein